MTLTHKPTVAVITATIGRDSLIRAIKSVQEQTYPCTHYVFVDGQDFHDNVKNLLKDDYPNVIVTYLPMNTGADGMCNSVINAIAPFLVKEDVICFLDDDNWYHKNHVKYLAEGLHAHGADYAYALRSCILKDDSMMYEDNIESLGFWGFCNGVSVAVDFTLQNMDYCFIYEWQSSFKEVYLIDTNCFAMTKKVAQSLADVWLLRGGDNDRNITKALLQSDCVGLATGRRTVYYLSGDTLDKQLIDRILPKVVGDDFCQLTHKEKQACAYNIIQKVNQQIKQQHYNDNGKAPWEIPTLFYQRVLTPLTD